MNKSEQENNILSKIIHVRIEDKTRSELLKEMKEKGIRRMSTYVRQIIDKRHRKTIRKTDEKSGKNDGISKQNYRELIGKYHEVLEELKRVSTMKNDDGTPVLNEKIMYEMLKDVNDRTNKMNELLKKYLHDNQNS